MKFFTFGRKYKGLKFGPEIFVMLGFTSKDAALLMISLALDVFHGECGIVLLQNTLPPQLKWVYVLEKSECPMSGVGHLDAG